MEPAEELRFIADKLRTVHGAEAIDWSALEVADKLDRIADRLPETTDAEAGG